METLYPPQHMEISNWFGQSSEWTKEENKKFESALAIYGEQDPERWFKVAAMIPGKTVYDVIKQYRELEEDVTEIEAGRFQAPDYLTSSFAVKWVGDHRDFDACRKRPLAAKSSDQERKKGVPWTEDEHRRFLMGLLKHGKGDWRNISRNFVVSKTPTQVASHAQKYFLRQQLSGVKDKKRPSIHDITTVNLTDTTRIVGNEHSSLDQSDVFLSDQKPTSVQKPMVERDYPKDESDMLYDLTRRNMFVSSPYELASAGLKFQGKNLYAGARINPHNLVFQMPSTRHKIRG